MIFLKKTEFFLNIGWKLPLIVCILNALFAPVSELRGQNREENPAGSTAETDAVIQFKDVKTQKQIDRINQEIISLKRKIFSLKYENGLLEKELKTLREEKSLLKKEKNLVSEEKSILAEEKNILTTRRESLRKELIEIVEKFNAQDADYRRLRLSIAASLAKMEKSPVDSKQEELLEALRIVSENSRKLAARTIEFCDHLKPVLKKFKMEKIARTRLKMKVEELEDTAQNVSALLEPLPPKQGKLTQCRILAVNDKLQVAVVGAGYIQGVRCGFNWYAGKNREIMLRVVATRPFVSAAVVVKGDLKDLAPGVVIYSGHK